MLIQAGGIWEPRKIAAMAESKAIAVAPHCPFGPIALAASVRTRPPPPTLTTNNTHHTTHRTVPHHSTPYRATPPHYHTASTTPGVCRWGD